jgi:hypothetical protein
MPVTEQHIILKLNGATGQSDERLVPINRHACRLLKEADIRPPAKPGETMDLAEIDAKLLATGFPTWQRVMIKNELRNIGLLPGGKATESVVPVTASNWVADAVNGTLQAAGIKLGADETISLDTLNAAMAAAQVPAGQRILTKQALATLGRLTS